jgi:hypothetical protein
MRSWVLEEMVVKMKKQQLHKQRKKPDVKQKNRNVLLKQKKPIRRSKQRPKSDNNSNKRRKSSRDWHLKSKNVRQCDNNRSIRKG